MGVAVGGLIEGKEVNLEYFSNKTIAIDAYNTLYQFLTTIRGADGTPLKDKQGKVTSHLVGLFGRSTSLMQLGIKTVYVFDGKPPALKQRTIEMRRKIKEEAERKLKEATEQQLVGDMRKYASMTTRLDKDMVAEAKQLLSYLGLPYIEAPSEGEAQAAHMVKKGDAYAVGSQDFDALINGTDRLVRNLSIAGKRKIANTFSYEQLKPELIELSEVLNTLGIDRNQLIVLALLVGTDYNPGGIKGIGPKTALKMLKTYGSNFDKIFEEAKWNDNFDFSWHEIYDLMNDMPVSDSYVLEWNRIDISRITSFLVDEHNFSEDRVTSTLSKLQKEDNKKNQRSLSDF